MRKRTIFILSVCLTASSLLFPTINPKILHLSFHQGCINDFKEVAKELGLEVTDWYIPGFPEYFFDNAGKGNSLYNMGHERAERIWNTHKEYFNSFDVILTSDTAPLSRIFLQNNFNKPLIIWVCNRFDYYDWASLDCNFPDQEYYDLFACAKDKKNVKIISYTPYEYFYASQKGIDIGTVTIKPIGVLNNSNDMIESIIPENICKMETLFIPPRLDDIQKEFLLDQCAALNIPVYCGNYNGPGDLRDFKGILNFPYAWSNIALFENIQMGLIHFVPTICFVTQLISENKAIRTFAEANLEWSEWYTQENNDLFVYFDSWEDLKQKIETTDYHCKKEQIILMGKENRQSMLNRWKNVICEIVARVSEPTKCAVAQDQC